MSERWLKATLLLSVTLNLLIIGAIAGFWISGAPGARPLPPHLGWVVRQLEPQTRESLKPLLKQYHQDSEEVRGQLKRAQQQVNELIVANPIDPDALSRSFEELRNVSADSQAMMHGAMVDILSRLDPQQRQQLLNGLNRNWRHEMRGPGRGQGRGRGPRHPPD